MSDLPNRPPPMGWPWDQLADAVLRWDDAHRRFQAAQVLAATVDTPSKRHDPAERRAAVEARYRAEQDLRRAECDLWSVREEAANQFLFGLRCAIEHAPTDLAHLLGRLPAAETVVEAVGELEDRADQLAANVKAARGECWELAKWLLRIEQQMGVAHGDRGPGEGQADGAAAGRERQAG